MRVRRSDTGGASLEMNAFEARAFLEEIAHIPGGSKLPKLREVCHVLEVSFGLSDGMFDQFDRPNRSRRKRP